MPVPESNDHSRHRTTGSRRGSRDLPLPLRRRRVRARRLTPRDERYLQRIHDFRQLLNGEWDWDVLVALHSGPLRYGELLSAVRAQTPVNNWPNRSHRHLQDSTLCRTLSRLTEAELIECDHADHFPFPATYQLAPTARELLAVVAPAAEWTEAHPDLLIRVQKRRRGELGG
ncbi:winged helix-turn-helix transcriptional regulator [Streptomyces sp. NPDC050704]|uniref:winged helix-turn-helix transcriptional regulator n=1 Tax=Streptomyces sp. NPDC050704 TaxID=3157219 RepID=UPI0034295F92